MTLIVPVTNGAIVPVTNGANSRSQHRLLRAGPDKTGFPPVPASSHTRFKQLFARRLGTIHNRPLKKGRPPSPNKQAIAICSQSTREAERSLANLDCYKAQHGFEQDVWFTRAQSPASSLCRLSLASHESPKRPTTPCRVSSIIRMVNVLPLGGHSFDRMVQRSRPALLVTCPGKATPVARDPSVRSGQSPHARPVSGVEVTAPAQSAPSQSSPSCRSRYFLL